MADILLTRTHAGAAALIPVVEFSVSFAHVNTILRVGLWFWAFLLLKVLVDELEQLREDHIGKVDIVEKDKELEKVGQVVQQGVVIATEAEVRCNGALELLKASHDESLLLVS